MPSKGPIPGEKGEKRWDTGVGVEEGGEREREERKARGKEWKAKKKNVFCLSHCHGHGSSTG